LPTRGGRGRPGFGAAGPGRGPGAAGAAGVAGAAVAAGAEGAAWTGGAVGTGAAGLGAVGMGRAAGACGVGALGTGAAVGAGAGAAAATFSGAAAGALPAAFSGALAPPNASRSLRATGASTVEDADLTNSPSSLSRARTSLLVTPSSFANSCTRALPAATTSPSLEERWVSRASGLATTHGHRRDFTVCSCSSLPSCRVPGGRAPLETSRSARPPRTYPVNR